MSFKLTWALRSADQDHDQGGVLLRQDALGCSRAALCVWSKPWLAVLPGDVG